MALISVSLTKHSGPDAGHQVPNGGIRSDGMAHEPVVKYLVLVGEEAFEGLALPQIEIGKADLQEAVEEQVQFQHAAPALPAQAQGVGVLARAPESGVVHSPLASINSLMWPMARVGLRPLGQTSTQFMMV